ncbi:MAG: hypothetical protein QXU32_01975 [Nitrososphaerales archaeon]
MQIDEIIKAINSNDIHTIIRLLGCDHLEFSNDEDPNPMDTIGQLVDKLSIVNNKMWANQEIIYAIRRMSTEEFIKKWGNNLEALHSIIKRCADLNCQRNRLMDEIDQRIVDALTGKIPIESLQAKQHKTY